MCCSTAARSLHLDQLGSSLLPLLITPPIGLNLYVVHAIRERGSVQDVVIGSAPFLAVMFLMIALLVLYPGIAMWLPTQVG